MTSVVAYDIEDRTSPPRTFFLKEFNAVLSSFTERAARASTYLLFSLNRVRTRTWNKFLFSKDLQRPCFFPVHVIEGSSERDGWSIFQALRTGFTDIIGSRALQQKMEKERVHHPFRSKEYEDRETFRQIKERLRERVVVWGGDAISRTGAQGRAKGSHRCTVSGLLDAHRLRGMNPLQPLRSMKLFPSVEATYRGSQGGERGGEGERKTEGLVGGHDSVVICSCEKREVKNMKRSFWFARNATYPAAHSGPCRGLHPYPLCVCSSSLLYTARLSIWMRSAGR